MSQSYNKKHLKENATVVTLEAGDILYHPAGIWHAVESTSDDSVSINFSLRQTRMADLLTNVIRSSLMQE
jgi:ribosomal protein L16 Arg81 hydroxylase